MKKILSLLAVATAVCCCSNANSNNNENKQTKEETGYYPKSDDVVRIVTYNIGSFSKYMDNSTVTVSNMLKEVQPDIVGLNEVDCMNQRHMVDQANALAKCLGKEWNSYFGKAMDYKQGGYGNAVVCPTKILDSYTVVLDKCDGGEQRSLAVVETDKMIFGAAHLDHKSQYAQTTQIGIISNWAKGLKTDKPVFFAGDMNATPESASIALICEDWDLLSTTANTFNSQNPSKCIDYVFHLKSSAPVTKVGSKVMTQFKKGDAGLASDHLPVYVDVKF